MVEASAGFYGAVIRDSTLGCPKAAEVRLTPEDRAVLEARVRAPTMEQRDVFRARIILLADEGHSTRWIARTPGTMPRTVSHRSLSSGSTAAGERKERERPFRRTGNIQTRCSQDAF